MFTRPNKSTVLTQNVANSLIQSHDNMQFTFKKENPVTLNKIPEEKEKEVEFNYPGFEFDSPTKGKNEPKLDNDNSIYRAPSLTSVLQQDNHNKNNNQK